MEHKEILTEDDLLAFYFQRYLRPKERYFPKVHTISTLTISPDIDLLFINKNQELVMGYEFKLLKYHEGWKRVNYYPLYAGIGEALLYFQHGIDKCYLFLGLSEMPPNWVDKTLKKIDQAINNFNILTKLFTSLSNEIREDITIGYLKKEGLLGDEKEPWGLGCFGIMVWTERDGLVQVKKKANQRFPINKDPDLKHKKECLLRGEFKYKKNFLKKIASLKT